MAINLNNKLTHQTSQNLTLTQTMRNAIEILQKSSQELEQYIEQKMEENVLLEQIEYEEQSDGSDNRHDEYDVSDDAEYDYAGDGIAEIEYAKNNLQDDVKSNETKEPTSDQDLSTMFNSDSGYLSSRNYNIDEDYNPLNFLSYQESYYELIKNQINTYVPTKWSKQAYFLLENIDDKGFLEKEYENEFILKFPKFNLKNLEKIIEIMQGFEPSGVFARNIAECYRIQLKHFNQYNDKFDLLLNNFDLIIKSDMAKFKASDLGLTTEELVPCLERLKTLTRNPLEDYHEENVTIEKPDLITIQGEDGTWFVLLCENYKLELKINQDYYNELVSMSDNKSTKKYVDGQFYDAKNLIKAINERKKHTWQIADEIVKYQQEFFKYGEKYLKPLVMKDIADLCGVNESTVSRIVNKRYITTPLGLKELKFFFNPSVKSISGTKDQSAVAVRNEIKDIIDAEDKLKPLSDDRIVTELMGVGIHIARRTVTKYRESMNIGSSNERRRMYKLNSILE